MCYNGIHYLGDCKLRNKQIIFLLTARHQFSFFLFPFLYPTLFELFFCFSPIYFSLFSYGIFEQWGVEGGGGGLAVGVELPS